VSLFTASPAYPLGQQGDEIVAAIVETQLSDTARKRIKELLPQGTTLADVYTWPDKGGRQIPDMAPFHYINFPKEANTYDQPRHASSATAAITWYVKVLKSSDAPRNETALRFVAHLVGDIHQPLHAGFAEDRGAHPSNPLDALIVGYYECDKLTFASKVRNGLVPSLRPEVWSKLKRLETSTCPFANLPEKKRTQFSLTREE